MSLPPHLLTPAAYARACGVSRQAIDARLKNKTLTLEHWPDAEGRAYVNTQAYPPAKLRAPSRRAPGLPPLPRRKKPIA